MKYDIKKILMIISIGLFTACGSSNSTSTTQSNKIVAYANTQGESETPTIEDYINANVVGVDENNIDDLNSLIAGLSAEEVDTTEEIQILLNSLGITFDTTAPIITLNGDVNVTLVQGEEYIEKGATAIDDIDGAVEVVISGEVNSSKISETTLTYSATDKSGNKGTVLRTVNVVAPALVSTTPITTPTAVNPIVVAAPAPTVAPVAQLNKFLFTIDTRLSTGSTSSFVAPVSTVTGGQQTYLYNIDCDNDGTDEAVNQNSPYTCQYATPGVYTVAMYGDIPTVNFSAALNNSSQLISVDQWGTNVWKSFNSSFSECSELTTFPASQPDLSQVTDLSAMFSYARKFNSNIDSWNVSTITNMSEMFFEADAFNSLLSSWDVSNVTSMRSMFRSANAFNSALNSWNVSNVIDFAYMFDNARLFNQDIGLWDVSSATSMVGMFSYAVVFNQDIGSWDVSSVTSMDRTFFNATDFNQDIGTWNVANVTTMYAMFADTSVFNQDIGSWNLSSVLTTELMFSSAVAFNQDIGSWNVSNVSSMAEMFSGATVFNQNINGWDVSSVTSMRNMFSFTGAFNQPLSSWDVSSVFSMKNMFYDASAFNQDVSSWSITSLTDAENMFRGTSIFDQTNLDLLLNAWSTLAGIQNSVLFDTNANYTIAVSGTARSNLINNNGWSITSGIGL